jgi:protein-disulfide isomerase
MATTLRSIGVVAITIGVLAGTPVVRAQSPPTQNEDVLNELREIRRLLEKLTAQTVPAPQPAAPAPRVKITDIRGYAIGKTDAPLTMIEFTDLQCPFCRQYHLTTFEKLKKDYVDTGLVRYISRDFPLGAIHGSAMSAAKAARCAGEQGKYWEMRHSLLLNNARMSAGLAETLAADLDIEGGTFQRCMATADRFTVDINNDVAVATALGVTGTPSFVVGRSSADGVDGALIVGAQPYAAFEARLKELMGERANWSGLDGQTGSVGRFGARRH